MSKKITCLIVEDEPIAAEVLEDYVRQVSHLELVGICKDALYAIEILQQQQIDLLFLDIHLPKLKGVDFVKTLKQKPYVIFTTAYHQYAVEGFEVEALDYLLKPISFPRFLQAVNRIPTSTLPRPTSPVESSSRSPDHLFFTMDKKRIKIILSEIIFVESLKDYARIHTLRKQFVIKYPLGELTNLLPSSEFVRVHRSYIVSIQKVTAYTMEYLEIGEHQIPIGRTYKTALKNYFSG